MMNSAPLLQNASFLAQSNSNSGGPVALLILLVFIVIALASLALWIYALIHAIKNPSLDSNMRLVWVLVIVLVGPIGAIIYLVAGK